MPLQDIVQESQRITKFADEKDVLLRLLGGLAVRVRCPSATHRALGRKYADIDFMGLRKQSRLISNLFIELDYAPREIFNRLQGDKRLIFNDLRNDRRVDVFLDVFEMCHRFDLRDRLALNEVSITLADLLATKLQVVEITEREYRDIIALIHDHVIGASDAPETINAKYIARLCADDWGIYKTFTTNLANVTSALPEYGLESEARELVRGRLLELQKLIEETPKTMRWKLRARVGEKMRWYELPERDKEIVNSQMITKKG